MYDSNGYIISDIDWGKFNNERYNAIEIFKRKGLKGIDLTEAVR